jgi:hypothetical protein
MDNPVFRCAYVTDELFSLDSCGVLCGGRGCKAKKRKKTQCSGGHMKNCWTVLMIPYNQGLGCTFTLLHTRVGDDL